MNDQSVSGIVGLGIAVLVYFLPSIVAFSRHKMNPGAAMVVNLFLGWTLIGWVVALAMAAGGLTREQAFGASRTEPQFSADRQWWWNGREWVPTNRRELP